MEVTMANTKKYEDDDVLSISDVIDYLQICRTTFYMVRKAKNFPKGFSLTGTRDCKWRFKEIKEWLEKQKEIPAEA